MRVFVTFGLLFVGAGGLIALRFLHFLLIRQGQGHIQSLILASILLIFGLLAWLLALLADVIAKNRYLAEEIDYRLKKLEFSKWRKTI